MFLQWRRFQFFEKELVKEEGTDAPHSLFQKISVTCATSGRGRLIFGDAEGFLNLVERDFKTVVSFQAYERTVTHCQQLRESPFLVTVGDDEEAVIAPTIKIWNLDRADRTQGNNAALCVRIIKLQRLTSSPLVPVTALAVLDDLSQLAVGLCNGAVLLLRGDLARDRHSKQIVLQEPDVPDPVTALHFRPPAPPSSPAAAAALSGTAAEQQQAAASSSSGSSTVLYVVSTASIWAYFTPSAGARGANEFYKAELDADRGAGLGCSTLLPYDGGALAASAAGGGGASGGGTAALNASAGSVGGGGSSSSSSVGGSGGGELVVARPEAVYVYTPDGRGPCFAFEGDKKLVGTFRGYLWLAGQERDNNNNNNSGGGSGGADRVVSVGSSGGAGGSGPGGPKVQLNWLTIYDIKNKLIAYSELKFGAVQQVLSEWGQLFVLSADPYKQKGGAMLWRLHEKDSGSKLETLFNKKLFPLAISLAQSHGADRALVVDIYRRYADHLYDKGDYDGAMQQYINTISSSSSSSSAASPSSALAADDAAGHGQHPQQQQHGGLEPSYVIRRFLDAQRIRNLTAYLQALHAHGLASPDHTALLFNCYTKLNDVAKLDQFVRADSPDSPLFELDTALRALRQAGYYQHALFVAQRHRAHEWYLRLLLDDLVDRAGDALDYIAHSLDFFAAERALKKYGKRLLDAAPADTTNLLIRLCSGAFQPDQPSLRAAPEEFIHTFVEQPDSLQFFLEKLLSSSGGGGGHQQLGAPGSSGGGQQQQQQQQQERRKILDTTLLELYLRPDGPDDVRKARRKKALDFLTDPNSKYDLEQALVLCKQHEFRPGLVYLYERLQLYSEVGRYYMQLGDSQALLKACNKFGDLEPQLWRDALAYFAAALPPPAAASSSSSAAASSALQRRLTSATAAGGGLAAPPPLSGGPSPSSAAAVSTGPTAVSEEEARKVINEVLLNIERDNLLPPLLVIQILSSQPNATLGLVRDYINRKLQHEAQLVHEDKAAIAKFSDETRKMRAEMAEVRTSARIFQLNKCSYCSAPLDLPAVHFFCLHSFHQRCLGEIETECPLCQAHHKKVLEIKRNLDEQQTHHDQFFKQLEGSQDGFSTVAEYFGRSVFNPSTRPRAADLPRDRGKPNPHASRELLFK